MGKSIHQGPEKVVVVAGPTFCEALKFTLLGAALGAAAVHYFNKEQTPTLGNQEKGYGPESKAAPAAEADKGTVEKIARLAGRARDISGRAMELAQSAAEAIKPALDQAVAQGKQAAAEMESRLKKDMEQAGDQPVLAREDIAEKAAGEPGKTVE